MTASLRGPGTKKTRFLFGSYLWPVQMIWGRTLNKALNSYDLPTDFGRWSILAADRRVWQQQIGIRAPCPRPATTLIHGKWRELFDGPT